MARNMIKKSIYNKKWSQDNKDHIENQRLIKRFGITLKEYKEFEKFCENKCSICKESERSLHSVTKKPMRLSIDHDPSNGVIRGLLCSKCNRGIGMFDDSLDKLQQAVEYLNLYKEVLAEETKCL